MCPLGQSFRVVSWCSRPRLKRTGFTYVRVHALVCRVRPSVVGELPKSSNVAASQSWMTTWFPLEHNAVLVLSVLVSKRKLRTFLDTNAEEVTEVNLFALLLGLLGQLAPIPYE